MTAGLLGWIRAVNAAANALVERIRDCRSRRRTLPGLVPARSQRFPGQVALRAERGFTLTELMVSVGIVGVLSAMAAPSVSTMIATQQVKTATFDLYATLSYARSEAIKRNSVVTITPRGGNFANGYDLNAAGVVLKSELGTPSVTINAPAVRPLAFNGFGRLTTSAPYQLELSSAQDSSIAKRCLVISTSGRPSIRVDINHDDNCING
jgi:type IV fimbrial biogenesis protein FimT